MEQFTDLVPQWTLPLNANTVIAWVANSDV